jgi:gas vesicle protein
MNSVKDRIVSTIVISTLVLAACVMAGFASNGAVKYQSDALFVASAQGREINAEFIKKSISLYQSLSEDKKAAIREKMTRMSQDRQKNIEVVSRQIKQYRLQQSKQKQTTSRETRISRLQALQQFALKENAPQIAKRFERIISLYEDIQSPKSLEDNDLKVE